jgi:ATP-dependent Lhr-like helicase
MPRVKRPQITKKTADPFAIGRARVEAYFASRGWTAFAFQKQTWDAYLNGQSGLVHAPTGSGKTWSVFGGPAIEGVSIADCRLPIAELGKPTPSNRKLAIENRQSSAPLTLLWLTPMRALANDTTHNLDRFCKALELNWSVELRTSDTTQTMRKKQRERLPSLLVTTPESLSMLLSYEDAREKLSSIRCVVVDEWHELLATKRGTQTELGLARLRAWNPLIRTWGLSATLGNLVEAGAVLIPTHTNEDGTKHAATKSLIRAREISDDEESATTSQRSDRDPSVTEAPDVLMEAESTSSLLPPPSSLPLFVHSNVEKLLHFHTVYPKTLERFPWAGHIGGRMAEQVGEVILAGGSTLVFTNTRAQAEIWFRALMQQAPDLIGQLAIHHGSLDRKLRNAVEDLLRAGKIKAVVCTSSLDLGVDFAAVDQVIQVGSPKGIARLMQRAGRSGHRPGEPSHLYCVPTHAFELIEFSAAREGIELKTVESRRPIMKPLDVLVQHVVTLSSGGGFDVDALYDEIITAHAYKDLTKQEWGWVIDFVTRGGPTLTAYDRFQKVKQDVLTGKWTIANDRLARLHRLGIGTIVGDGTITLVHGFKKLGTVEEGFIGRMKPGDVFTFAGQALELLSLRQMVAKVRPNKKKTATIVSWPGAKFPLSTMLSHKVRERLEQATNGVYVDDEMKTVKPILDIQARWSHLPKLNELLIETMTSREGVHIYLYPFLGRLVHEGLAAVIGHRIGRSTKLPVTATFTDYGIELLIPRQQVIHSRAMLTKLGMVQIKGEAVPENIEERAGFGLDQWQDLLSPTNLLTDLFECLNAGELARRQFREIARIAGLLVPTTPGSPKSTRQLQASSELFYDVFVEFDPQNLLLEQARREVLEQQLEIKRLTSALEALKDQQIVMRYPERFTPMAFPLWAQRIASQTIRTEAGHDRIGRMLEELEQAADE